MPTLTVQRDRGMADKVRAYRIIVDGESIGSIGEGEILRKTISEGPHEVQAKIDWCSSRPVQIAADSRDVVLEVRSALRGWRLALGLFYVMFHRRGYLQLHVVEGLAG